MISNFSFIEKVSGYRKLMNNTTNSRIFVGDGYRPTFSKYDRITMMEDQLNTSPLNRTKKVFATVDLDSNKHLNRRRSSRSASKNLVPERILMNLKEMANIHKEEDLLIDTVRNITTNIRGVKNGWKQMEESTRQVLGKEFEIQSLYSTFNAKMINESVRSLPERLPVLVDYGAKILKSLEYLYEIMKSTDEPPDIEPNPLFILKPLILTETAFSSINKLLNKKFPLLPDISHTKGFQEFCLAHNEVMQSCEIFYSCMLRITHLYQESIIALNDVSQIVPNKICFTSNIAIYSSFIMSNIVNIFIILAQMPELKVTVAAFKVAKDFIKTFQQGDDYYDTISSLIVEYEENVLSTLQANFSFIGPWFGNLFESLKPDIQTAMQSCEALRRDNNLNILVPFNIDGWNLQSYLTTLTRNNTFFKSLSFNALLFPDELNKPSVMETVKYLHQYQLAAPLFGSEMIDYKKLFEAASKSHSKGNKSREAIQNN
ncbi:hypothetical protein ROZALSC1DRAFT_28353 [Rozella allomycis CSF55]|uniref:Uncharacterized protein n=1 Tax=Rozella allomycis (strain CSF55) TaxID=988480 RepID=A0A4P9YKJ8_ROZAC|nr:hypothetical protein ROZALSC1DRAFT_28353 [Rozella allomycis CSF55]